MEEEAQPINNISPQEGMSKIYKYLIIGIMVAVVLIIGLVVMKFSLMKQTSDIKDCKESLKCFRSAIEDGKLSKAMFTTTVDILGMKQTSTNYMELRNCEDSNCLFYISYVNASAEFAPGTPQVAIDASKQAYEALKGKNGTCIFKKEDLISMLNNWEAGNFSTEDFSVANCSGNYFGWSEIPQNNHGGNNQEPSQINQANNISNTCTEIWQCGSWSTCANNQQTRTCSDSNNCGTITNKPSITQSCTSTPTCTESWTCLDWSSCTSGTQTRTCSDSNNCGTTTSRPILVQNCQDTSCTIEQARPVADAKMVEMLYNPYIFKNQSEDQGNYAILYYNFDYCGEKDGRADEVTIKINKVTCKYGGYSSGGTSGTSCNIV